MTTDLDAALKALNAGRDVLFSPHVSSMDGLEGKFVPVFWSPVHFPKQAGTMGLLCQPAHPALAAFPNDGHSDWQWWQLVKNAKVMNLDEWQQPQLYATSIIRAVDNFANNRRLSMAVEARVGKGRLLLTSMDLLAKTQYPEIRQMLHSLVSYMDSASFCPQATLTEEHLCQLIH